MPIIRKRHKRCKPRTQRVAFVVEFIQPKGAGVADCREYVLSAVKAERGLLNPDDPMFDLDKHSVGVTRHFNRKKEVKS